MQNDQAHSLQPSSSTTPIPIDPALSLYPPYYPNNYQQRSHIPQHLALSGNYPSPASQASDNTDHMNANSNGKRPGSNSPLDSRKKARTDDDSNANHSGTEKGDKEEVTKVKPTRGSRACTVCRRLKMKCVGGENGPPCKRCQTGNHECIFEESNRGKKSTKKHEILSRSLKKMEKTLDTVLRSIGNPTLAAGLISRSPSPSGDMPFGSSSAARRALHDRSPSPAPRSNEHQRQYDDDDDMQPLESPKLHSLPDNALNPLGLLAEASLANRRVHPETMETTAEGGVGVASRNYFKPGPMTILPLRRLYIERQVQPEMLTFVKTEEVVALFNIYFEHMHLHADLLDPTFHTPSLVCSRSPFLLTTICSIASKFYTKNPDLHPKLTELAKKLAFDVPSKGYKSVEIVQAYLLLALWGCGAVERYEQDKTWMLLGMGIRMATDLNLHKKTTAAVIQDTKDGGAKEAEMQNRERTWLMCFVLDRSFSSQMGKPYTIREDYIIRHLKDFYTAPAATQFDLGLCAYVDLQQIMSRSLEFVYSGTDSVSGLQKKCDYMLIVKAFDSQLQAWWAQWIEPHTSHTRYLRVIAEFYLSYCTLILNSFGLQNALERKPMNIPYFFARVHTAAQRCAILVRDHLAPSGYMKYSPDSHFVQMSYAVLSLLKLVRPEFQPFLENEREIISLVKDVADSLESIAANPLHTPALYSGFLRALIAAKLEPQGNISTKAESKSPGGDSSGLNHASTPGESHSQSKGNLRQQQQRQQNHHQQQSQHQHSTSYAEEQPLPISMMNDYQFTSEMGPVADISTFPPTMAPNPTEGDNLGMALTMENVLSSGFWDSMVVPGYNSMDGFSGGFVFGSGGSGLITPHYSGSPTISGTNTPIGRGYPGQHVGMSQAHLIDAFDG